MKTLLIAAVLATFMSSAQADELLKSCTANLSMGGESVISKTDFIKKNGKLIAETTNAEQYGKLVQDAKISTHKIKAGLTGSDTEATNIGESLVSYAMGLKIELAKLGEKVDAGLDLSKIRSATVYQIVGEEDEIGLIAVVEAKDKNGADLGSFISGFLVAPCNK